ncbi:Uncharacterised protein (plasmid) [Mesomycoplasma neurolyticum]|uniref:Uncharacterized protein n=1 Tax=Mesomycoplasma neurolyticum TaxID=2120 RepID=A0A449A6A9_9BACT|nr:Uncharacterised protein [Mesomycoplasma neurolyticum]VEU59913.1 Uncharacterised protein [Mesomycoplasma neurolyticum]
MKTIKLIKLMIKNFKGINTEENKKKSISKFHYLKPKI